MDSRLFPIALLMLMSQAVTAGEGDLYLFHNVYTNHLGGSSYFLRAEGEVPYEEDNNATGLRYQHTERLSSWVGYTPENSYGEDSVFAAVEYVWPLGHYLEFGAAAGVASGYDIIRNTADGWAAEAGPVVRVHWDRVAVSGVLINLDILVLNLELNVWTF